jgi:UDP-N-acetylglucosamine 4,6-dehydratase
MRTVLIGGTGTLGTALAELLYPKGEIVVLSRGEHAQKKFQGRFPKARMLIGDVRDRDAVRQAVRGAETVFLLAAIKHVDIAEANPIEAVKTNVLGAVNVAEEAIAEGVRHVVFSNTDKAVLPITSYGYSKALAQNYLLSQNGKSETKFSVFNWGNIIASQGSAIPIWVEAMLRGNLLPVTDPRMSRFWLRIETAARFMAENYQDAPTDRALIPPVKGATIMQVIESIARLLGVSSYSLANIGVRGVEKYHEVLESTHEGCLRSDTCEQYTPRELDDLLSDVVSDIAGKVEAYAC